MIVLDEKLLSVRYRPMSENMLTRFKFLPSSFNL